MPFDFSIALKGNVLLFVLMAVSGVGLVIVYYKFTIPPLPPRLKFLLIVLRSLAIIIILSLFYEPTARITHYKQQPPVVALLVDNSQSMTVSEPSGTYAAMLESWVKNNPILNLGSDARVLYNTFASTPDTFTYTLPRQLKFNGESTDLSMVMIQLKKRLVTDNIQAAVLLTDGNYNVGRNPLYDAEELGIPLFTVGVGDTTQQKDVLVERVLTNAIAYVNTRVPVDILIKSSGYRDQTVEVTISKGTNVLDRSIVRLAEGTLTYPVRLSIVPESEGVHKHTVRVSHLEGELTEKNNAQSLFIKVLKDKVRVVIFAGAPHPDVSTVKQIFAEDERMTVRAFVQKAVNEFYEGGYSRSTIDSSDCIVLINFPTRHTSSAVLKDIVDAIERTKKPLLFIQGKSVDLSKVKDFEHVLPFSSATISGDEIAVFPSVSDQKKHHPLINLEGEVTAETWQQLPPIVKSQTVFRAKPEAEVLATVKIQNVILPEPLVAIRNINRQKSFAITGYNVWQWRLMAQGNPQTGKFLSLLLTNAVRWLTTLEEGKNVRIVPTKEMFTSVEPVQFTAQVYNDQFRPVDNAEVTVDIQRGKETVSLALTPVGSGLYEGSLERIGEGDFTFHGKASIDGLTLGEDKGRFTVGELNLEFLQTTMNKHLLEQMAFRTGGKFYPITYTSRLVDDIRSGVRLSPRELAQRIEIELWNWQYFIAALLLLFIVEWFLRKRSGML